MTADDPVKGLGKEVEDVWGGFETEPHADIVVELILPCKTQEMPISTPERDMTECGLKVEFSHEGAWPERGERSNSSGEHLVGDVCLRVEDAIIDRGAARPRKVVYPAWFGGSFPNNRAEG